MAVNLKNPEKFEEPKLQQIELDEMKKGDEKIDEGSKSSNEKSWNINFARKNLLLLLCSTEVPALVDSTDLCSTWFWFERKYLLFLDIILLSCSILSFFLYLFHYLEIQNKKSKLKILAYNENFCIDSQLSIFNIES